VRSAVVESVGRSLHVVFLLAAPVAAIALPLLLCMKELPLRTAAYIEGAGADHGAAAE
jgi:hypothetical protein